MLTLPLRRSSISRVGWMEGWVRAESQQVPNGSAGSRQWWDVSKIISYCFFFFFAFNTSIISRQTFKCIIKILKYVRLFMAWIFRHLSRGFLPPIYETTWRQTFVKRRVSGEGSRLWNYTSLNSPGRFVKIIFNLHNLHELCRMQWNFFFHPFRFKTLRWVSSSNSRACPLRFTLHLNPDPKFQC